MNDETLERLLTMRGPDFPPVRNQLNKLPDDHPLKMQVIEEQEMAASIPAAPTTDDRLADLEARVAELEGKA